MGPGAEELGPGRRAGGSSPGWRSGGSWPEALTTHHRREPRECECRQEGESLGAAPPAHHAPATSRPSASQEIPPAPPFPAPPCRVGVPGVPPRAGVQPSDWQAAGHTALWAGLRMPRHHSSGAALPLSCHPKSRGGLQGAGAGSVGWQGGAAAGAVPFHEDEQAAPPVVHVLVHVQDTHNVGAPRSLPVVVHLLPGLGAVVQELGVGGRRWRQHTAASLRSPQRVPLPWL